MIGVALRSAASRTSRPGRWAVASARASAWRRIRSDRFRLPLAMSLAVKRAVVRFGGSVWYFVIRGIDWRRGMLASPRSGRRLGTVLAAALLPVTDAGRVEGAADDVVLDRREVLDPPTADEDDGVFLEVVADPRDVGRDLHLVRQPDAGDLAEGRVRLLGRHRSHLETDAALLRGARDRHLAAIHPVPVLAHGRRLDLRDLARAAVSHELADRRHEDAAPFVGCRLGGGRPAGRRRRERSARGTLLGWCSRRVVDARSTADPCRGHDRAVYRRPKNRVKRIRPESPFRSGSRPGGREPRIQLSDASSAPFPDPSPELSSDAPTGDRKGFSLSWSEPPSPPGSSSVRKGLNSPSSVAPAIVAARASPAASSAGRPPSSRNGLYSAPVSSIASPARASRAARRSRSLRAATFAGAPVPAGISLPMITFSFSPIRWSLAPLIAASVSTRVVSWKEAAARNDEVLRDALVTPRSTVWAVAGSPPSDRTLLFSSSKSSRSISSVGSRSTSPGWSIRTFRSICRTMISMCLSLIVTPWLR